MVSPGVKNGVVMRDRDDCTVAILCGGTALRMGSLGGHWAKTLLAAHDTPLLWRLLDQLQSAGFDRIVASTTPRFERQIAEAVQYFQRDRPTQAGSPIHVVANEAYRRGVLVGLAELLDRLSTPRCLTCLGDIFFLANPFVPFPAEIRREYDCLGVASFALKEEMQQGGLVYHADGKVTGIVERHGPATTGQPVRWSGIALIDRARAASDLEAFRADAPADSPAGDFFEFQRARARDIRCVWGPDFVNVNSSDHLLLASLLARLEKPFASDPLRTSLAQCTASLRLHLANQPRGASQAG